MSDRLIDVSVRSLGGFAITLRARYGAFQCSGADRCVRIPTEGEG